MTNNIDDFYNIVLRAVEIQSQFAEDSSNDMHPFDERNIHPEIDNVARKLFDDGHYSQATFEAYKYLDKYISEISNFPDSGQNLMMNAFSEKNPLIKLTNLSTTSEIDEQRGFKFLFAGSTTAIRNPRGHEVGNNDTIEKSLDHLSLASFLLRRINDRIAPN